MESEGTTSTICSHFQSVLMIGLTSGSGSSVFCSLIHWISGPNSRKKRNMGKADREQNYRQLNSLPVKQPAIYLSGAQSAVQRHFLYPLLTVWCAGFLILFVVICLEDILIEFNMLTCGCVPSDAPSCAWEWIKVIRVNTVGVCVTERSWMRVKSQLGISLGYTYVQECRICGTRWEKA